MKDLGKTELTEKEEKMINGGYHFGWRPEGRYDPQKPKPEPAPTQLPDNEPVQQLEVGDEIGGGFE